ncbi:MAG: integrase arm-type DNA-binding domain-containing protein [Rhodanobacter sp.]|jgi:integrase|nr:integrase arm-type DNA-binding domain-containing protein [Rhodanobacter sp.]
MLTEAAIKNAKPGIIAKGTRKGERTDKPYKLADAGGLYLEVQPGGGKWWRLKYRFTGVEKRLSFGVYPDVSLADARARRDESRKLLADGVDPSAARKAAKAAGVELAANSFETVAREWFAKFSQGWAKGHADRIIRRLERDVFPWIGGRPVAALTAPDVLAVLRRIESRGSVETAHRACQNCGQILRYAVATGRVPADVTRDLRGALTPWKPEHFASITEPAKVADLLRAIEAFSGTFPVRCALRLLPLVFTRPGELRAAEWAEFDLDGATWNIPAERMKLRLPHVVPLSTQAVVILRELHPLTGAGRYVFPGARSAKKPLSDMTFNAALRRMGFDKGTITAHGFRAMARTILDEGLGFRPDFIEHQLAHAVRDPNGRAYNRTAHMPERRAMMQAWADYLDGLRTGANVVPIRRVA